MNKVVFGFLLLSSLLFSTPHYPCVTYGNAGRFGDWLISYIHAKWISVHQGVPLLYRPFPYSEELVLSDQELSYEEAVQKGWFSQVGVAPYFPESILEMQRTYPEWQSRYFCANLQNREFVAELRRLIAPKKPLDLTEPPGDTINIAIHVREGGGFDLERTRTDAPEKLPPLSYYSMALNLVLPLLQGKEIYCHLFTDARDPEAIAKILQESLPSGLSLSWGYREKGNHHTANVLEDFFSLLNFDVLIRPDSNFSIVPSIIHDYAILCTPARFAVQPAGITTEEVSLKVNYELFQSLLQK